MRSFSSLLGCLALLLAGCGEKPKDRSSDQSRLVGTWRWVQLDQRQMAEAFHVRYYADGMSASWPAPPASPNTTNGISRGRYRVEGDYLVFDTGAGANDPKALLDIRGDEMILIDNESHRLVYRRVIPDLEPGK